MIKGGWDDSMIANSILNAQVNHLIFQHRTNHNRINQSTEFPVSVFLYSQYNEFIFKIQTADKLDRNGSPREILITMIDDHKWEIYHSLIKI